MPADSSADRTAVTLLIMPVAYPSLASILFKVGIEIRALAANTLWDMPKSDLAAAIWRPVMVDD